MEEISFDKPRRLAELWCFFKWELLQSIENNEYVSKLDLCNLNLLKLILF